MALFFAKVFTFFDCVQQFTTRFNFLLVKDLVLLFVDLVFFDSLNFFQNVFFKVHFFDWFPLVSKLLDYAFCVELFVFRKAAVLAKSVDANNKLAYSCFVVLRFYFFEILHTRFKIFRIGFSFFFPFNFCLLKSSNFILLNTSLLIASDHIIDSSIKSFLKKTTLILKPTSHIRTKPWHFKKVNPRLPDNFLNQQRNRQNFF